MFPLFYPVQQEIPIYEYINLYNYGPNQNHLFYPLNDLQRPSLQTIMPSLSLPPDKTGASGFCSVCSCEHQLATGNSRTRASSLIEQLNRNENICFDETGTTESDYCSTLPLWGEARGKMFGVLQCLTKDNTTVDLFAFSGQFNGQWLVAGWVPPLFDVQDFHRVNNPREKKIKNLTRAIEKSPPHSQEWLDLRKTRKESSRKLMKDIHALYSVTNFKGETKTLEEVYQGKNNIPTGTGDCCAPKLLNYAAKKELTPTGICEFFYGKETKSGSHSHGNFSSPCMEKCAPILGFMLCGL